MDRNGIPDRFTREIRPSTKHYISDTYINTKRVCLTFSMRTQKWKRSAHVNSHLETSIFKHVWTCFDLHPISSWHTDPLKWKLVREKGLGRIPGGIGKWMGVKTMNFRCETWFAQHLLEPNSESMCQQKNRAERWKTGSEMHIYYHFTEWILFGINNRGLATFFFLEISSESQRSNAHAYAQLFQKKICFVFL